MISTTVLWFTAGVLAAADGGSWGPPASVTHDEQPCITYRAQITANGNLAVDVKLASGWHTFTMDNDKRAAAKLGGKKALSSDKPTQILPEAPALEITGPWLQPQPKDFSQPDLRIFSWGYEGEALFVAPAKAIAGSSQAPKIRIKAQACSQTVCKNIDLVVEAPVSKDASTAVQPTSLIPVL